MATFVLIASVGVTAALVSSQGGHHRPRPLALADASSGRALTAAAPVAGGGSYVLVGTLPSGTPDDAPAWTVRSRADRSTVETLARALGAGTVTHDTFGWRAGGLGLSDTGGGQWWWSPCAADVVVSSDTSAVGCAVAVGGVAGSVSGGAATDSGAGSSVTPAPPPTAPGKPVPTPVPIGKVLPPPPPAPVASDATVRAAARPVFEALGLDPAQAQVADGVAVLNPVVGGLPTVGLTTRVAVEANGTIAEASGWLVDQARGDTYPLVTAQQAFDALPELPRMMLACPVGPDGQGCLQPQPQKITGAHLGLAVHQLVGGTWALVPAWLFDVEGSPEPVASVAVQPQYLPSPEPPAASTRPVPEPGTVTPEGAPTKPSPR